MYFHHECYLFFWQHIKYSIELVQCFCGELFPHSIHSSSNCFPRQRFSHSHITFDAVIFQKKKYFFVRNNDAWERKTLCRWKREKTNVNDMYGLRDGSWTLIIDLLWRKQHFAQIEMLMRWFFTLAKKRHETANIEYEWTDWKCDRNGCHLTLSNSIDNADSMKRSCDMKHYFNGNVFQSTRALISIISLSISSQSSAATELMNGNCNFYWCRYEKRQNEPLKCI